MQKHKRRGFKNYGSLISGILAVSTQKCNWITESKQPQSSTWVLELIAQNVKHVIKGASAQQSVLDQKRTNQSEKLHDHYGVPNK